MVVAAVPFLLVQVLTSLTMIRFEETRLDPLVVRLWESCLGGAPVFPILIELGQNWITWLVIGLAGTGLECARRLPRPGPTGSILLRDHRPGPRGLRVAWGILADDAGPRDDRLPRVSRRLTINLAGLFLFCGGLFLTLPWTNLLLAVTYDVLSEASGIGGSYPDAE